MLSLKDCWNFEFNYKNDDSINSILGDKINGQYNYNQLLNSCGVKIIKHRVTNVHEELELIRQELFKSLPVIHTINAYDCPCNDRFNKYKDNLRANHSILIIGIDDDNKTLKCTDGWYNKKSENLHMDYFIKGYTSYCYTFKVEEYLLIK